MIWIAPSEKDLRSSTVEKRLRDSADQFRANSGPLLGIIFLRFAEIRFAQQRAKLEKAAGSSPRGTRVDEPAAYHIEGIPYLRPNARVDFPLNLPEAADIGAKVNDALRDIEKHNPQLAGVLLETYNLFTSTLRENLLKTVSNSRLPRIATPSDASTNTRRRIRPRRGPEGRRVLPPVLHRPSPEGNLRSFRTAVSPQPAFTAVGPAGCRLCHCGLVFLRGIASECLS